ncbi:hypothetical protein [Halolactibacillus sp. JCM 19043]|uniref:hypothetical protein n=1 Tax=Halolactibacillus sp. JCM 19043 TaxID=1460638 RepID=UPI001E60A69C|nr:hypothetical protein [Halolactibacillus sp. JCM 19043]
MKKIIIAALLLLMFGYSLYEFVDPFGDDGTSEDFDIVEGDGSLEESDEASDQTDAVHQ